MSSRACSSAVLLLLAAACTATRAIDADVVRPAPGAPFLDELPGPLLGPFNAYSSALLAACNKIIAKPNVTAGGRADQNFDTFWRASSEYCAWIYYTPDQKYMISKLTDQSMPDPAQRQKNCALPYAVRDSHYPAGSLEYIYAVHSHSWDSTLSDNDIRFIVSAGARHGFEAATKDGKLRLSIVAFFSRRASAPTCDGFHQYIPLTSQVLKWSKEQTGWTCEQTGVIRWNDEGTDFVFEQRRVPCTKESAP